jgi:broad specificity phosphatase PhoE
MFANTSMIPFQYKIAHSSTDYSNNHSSETNSTSVLLRPKANEQTGDFPNRRKRLSDPIVNSSRHSNKTSSNELNENTTPAWHRRSLRFPLIPSTLQTIHQRSSLILPEEAQKLLLVRHGERVDSIFGPNWIDQVFEKGTGIYRRINLNLPKKMVQRKDLKDFLFDPPITELGLYHCQVMGEELALQDIQIDHVYSSPALRCIQTADRILQGLGKRDRISIRIEPCLFEFLKWYPIIPVKWPFLDLQELTDNGYNVDRSYKPFYPIESLRKDEDELMYYNRSHLITTSILRNHQADQGNVLIVGHVSEMKNECIDYESDLFLGPDN